MKWGQIERDEEGAWVRWRPGAERRRLPGEDWEALQAQLKASGRLEGMREESYVFAPLAYPGKEETGYKAEDWFEERHISSSALLASLKLYGRLAKIPEEKLTLMTLRRTATRLRLEAGDSLEEMLNVINITSCFSLADPDTWLISPLMRDIPCYNLPENIYIRSYAVDEGEARKKGGFGVFLTELRKSYIIISDRQCKEKQGGRYIAGNQNPYPAFTWQFDQSDAPDSAAERGSR